MKQKKTVIALGFFDGVHLGHAALLHKVTQVATQLGAVAAACTFDTHPENLIFHQPISLLSSPNDRADLMGRLYHIDQVIVAHFDDRMMKMPWQEFVTDFLIAQHGAIHLVAGHDFHFGYKGEGNPQRLQALCATLGIGCDIIGKVEQDGITISSTYIRTLIAQGEVERANAFLGHPHTLSGTVTHGKKLGSTLGFPTVNLTTPPHVLPPANGVYATKVRLPDGRHLMAATNVGIRPTVQDGNQLSIEGFLLDFVGDLYDQRLQMEFYARLRGEQAFPTLDALQSEVDRNVTQTRDYFSRHH